MGTKYRLLKGTMATGSLLKGDWKVVKSSDPDNNTFESDDPDLATKEPQRYARVTGQDGGGVYRTASGEEYHVPSSPEQVDAEIERLKSISEAMKAKAKAAHETPANATTNPGATPAHQSVVKEGELKKTETHNRHDRK